MERETAPKGEIYNKYLNKSAPMVRPSIGFAIIYGIFAAVFAAASTWTSVSMDSTGKYLTASSTVVYTSDDYGATWKAGTTQIPWSSVASDSTGQKLAGVATCTTSSYCFSPYESTDRGVTWNMTTAAVPKDNYYAMSVDSTGEVQVIAGGEGILQSSNGGKNWGRYKLDQGYNGNVAAMSASGKTALIVYKEMLTTTSDGGQTFKTLYGTPEARWRGVSIDSAAKVIAGAYDLSYESGGNYESAWYVSTDGGTTFTAVKLTNEGEKYYTVAVSADGKYVHCGGSSGIYTYNVATKAVTKSNAPVGGYYSIATSQNGKYVLAATSSLYLSSDYGATYAKVN